MLEQRLVELRKEFKLGTAQLEVLDQQRAQLRDTLLRISGAMQVVEELLSQQAETPASIEAAGASLATTR
jgi:hypothetical protein